MTDHFHRNFVNVEIQPSPNRWSIGVYVAPQAITDNQGNIIDDNLSEDVDTNPSR